MEIKLKKLLENFSANGGNSQDAALTREEKRKLHESVKNYNSLRESLKLNHAYESISKITETITLAERYALKESTEWMEAKMIQDDFKNIKKLAEAMSKEIQTLQEAEKKVEMLYERVGVQLERYFKID
jgi:hypothetical protein